uniref:Metalloendopeptidase n=1 Tax=Parastrongyloides trichosuri TaxID=131310 RepID=A0A0N4ZLH2_PARTI
NIQSNTCIKFEKQNNKIASGYGINFVWASPCGFQFYGHNPNKTPLPQVINISTDCDSIFGIQALLHNTLMVKNEHTRTDRDEYIKIHWGRQKHEETYSFYMDNATDTTFYGMAYDYGSLTHFSPTQYSDKGQEVITANKYHEYYKKTMGQRVMATFNDYKLLNYYYCNDTCTPRKSDCEYDGYQDPNNCTICKCPSGFVGSECQYITPSSSDCGSWGYTAGSTTQTISISGEKDCYFKIVASNDKKIKMTLRKIFVFGFDTTSVRSCVEGLGLDIKYRKSKAPMGVCFCQQPENLPIVIESEDNVVYLHYRGTYDSHRITIEYQQIS